MAPTMTQRARSRIALVSGVLLVLALGAAQFAAPVIELGPLRIFHPTGALWLEAELVDGRLDGPVRTYGPDGALESETRFDHGETASIAAHEVPPTRTTTGAAAVFPD